MLPFKGTFPIGNLIPGLRLGFFKDTLFQKLWSNIFRVLFLVLFSLKIKNKISGDSNFFSKINFSQIKSESCRSSGDAREKCGSTHIFTFVCILNPTKRSQRTLTLLAATLFHGCVTFSSQSSCVCFFDLPRVFLHHKESPNQPMRPLEVPPGNVISMSTIFF